MEKTRPTAVDVVVIHNDKILFVKRENPPFKNRWVLPGGFVEINEDVKQAAVRETKEETGIDIELIGIIGVYSKPERDERHTISIGFIAFPKGDISTKAQKGEAKEAKWFDLSKIPKLGFDHDEIVKDAIEIYNSMQCHGCEHCSGCD